MAGLPSGGNSGWMNNPVVLIIVIIISSLQTVAQEVGFLSIDCGSSALGNYTDPVTRIQWAPDAMIWPDIPNWSAIAPVSPPTMLLDQTQYTTLRYFPSNKALKQSKFCYTLPAISGNYYLIRASFWYGVVSTIYETRVSNQIRFHVIVDNYEGVEIVIDIPQNFPWFEEMYIRAQTTFVSVCLSAASDSSDAPFINSLELRPLSPKMTPVGMIGNTNQAMRTLIREESGTLSFDPPILRYPGETFDRFWFRYANERTNVIQTTEDVGVEGMLDFPPIDVVQTSFVAGLITFNITRASSVLTTSTMAGSHKYFLAMFFAEIDPRVNASGQRVFDITVNGDLFAQGVDIYTDASGMYKGLEYYTNTSVPLGPYSDNIIIESKARSTSIYPASIAGIEVLQLFDNPMNATTPTSSNDLLAIQDIITSTLPTLQNFIGDPCLPLAYKHPWIDCDYSNNLNPARVTSLLLSNYSLVGNIPSSISNLDQLVTLDLSNNKLTGTIPDSLSNLPKLTYLNLANNNFSGTIPQALLQKKGLVFSYEGNNNLCNPNNGNCQPSTKSNIGLIIGASVGAVLFVIIIITTILCIVKRRKNREKVTTKNQLVQTTTYNYEDPHVNVDEKVLIKKEDLIDATNIAQQFTYQEMLIATNNLSAMLGQGGSGVVYKGNLPNGLDVAVKIISHPSQQGSQEFLNEVSLLSRVHHKNLVGFVGYSIERSLMLVYEFMANGSLHDALSRRKASRTLAWPQRLQILSDAAQGLAYLHDGCNIIHRDVKTSNILLSRNLEGKVSDFGISKFTSIDANNATTRIVGTMGYLDPEYAATLRLTEKVDIYSFGVVILEAICGKLPIVSTHANFKNVDVHIADWVRPSFEQGMIQEVVDERLKDEYNLSSMWKVVEIAMECVEREGIKRPTMYQVCNVLREAMIMESNHESSPMVTGEMSSIYSNVQAR